MLYDNPGLKFKDKNCSGEIVWQSPSNIALVKYWGKKGFQIPSNPSISFSLNKSNSETRLKFNPAKGNDFTVNFTFDGTPQPDFEKKIITYFKSLNKIFPFIEQLDFEIESKNTFPHSAGIASSASGMSALALTLCDIERYCFNKLTRLEDFFQKASFIARLGSGSAARSLYGGWVVWGAIEGMEGTSDLYGIPIKNYIHSDFLNYQDTILLVETGTKKVSSRVGHDLMNSNLFAKDRFAQARQNAKRMVEVLKTGDIDEFIRITESEALTLHAMMMTSEPSFLLIKPETVSIIEEIRAYREKTKTPVCFTLDAGPNVHLLYPKSVKAQVKEFINDTLIQYVSKNGFIDDEIGPGPRKMM
ncbi:MAG: diphosphomevalonate decarboxylase [Bacteroidales bacterium]|nr:diphosphomevalonate decarboxylase [Bacteroidales bacterium]